MKNSYLRVGLKFALRAGKPEARRSLAASNGVLEVIQVVRVTVPDVLHQGLDLVEGLVFAVRAGQGDLAVEVSVVVPGLGRRERAGAGIADVFRVVVSVAILDVGPLPPEVLEPHPAVLAEECGVGNDCGSLSWMDGSGQDVLVDEVLGQGVASLKDLVGTERAKAGVGGVEVVHLQGVGLWPVDVEVRDQISRIEEEPSALDALEGLDQGE